MKHVMSSRKWIGLVTLVVVLASFSSCASAPSPRQKEMEAKWQLSGKSWAATAKFQKPMAWKAGQYVVTGNRNKGKIQSTSRMLIASKEKTGWILEVSTQNADGKDSVGQYLLEGYDEAVKSGDFSKMRFAWMKMRDEKGAVSVISGEQMAMFNAFSKSTLDAMAVSFKEFNDGGELVVPAGSFPGSNKVLASAKVMGFNVETMSWYHPSVPVNGMVKSVTTDGKSETVLLSFGFDGKPELPLK